jgi:hypothetical protein
MQYWFSELESLGFKVRLNEFNNIQEISNLCQIIKQRLIKNTNLRMTKTASEPIIVISMYC